MYKLRVYFIDSHAELGSRPSVEGPMDPDGPTEYTEQTMDAESQVEF